MSIQNILEREHIQQEIKSILNSFEENRNNIFFKKGIYIYGSPGCGKTEFVMEILKDLNYDVIKYDAGDVRNKSLIDTITSNNISNYNVLHKMQGVTKKIAIVMDEIDGMNNGDKGGITSLIKLIRQKKTKKQRLESKTLNPVICIGNYYIDKKIKELIKVCNTFELKTPTDHQISQLIQKYIPTMSQEPDTMDILLKYIQGDMRKLQFIVNIYKKKPHLMTKETIENIFHIKSYNEDTKKITQKLINQPVNIREHNTFMNETDRTIVSLLWHENIVDTISGIDKRASFPFYLRILENICYADYVDRITFQNQIWQFNEMSSMMKTFYNNKILHDTFGDGNKGANFIRCTEVRFTKVLTKYSTEYNNILFIFNLCQELNMDKKDLIAFFQELRLFFGKEFYQSPEVLNRVEGLFENYNINKLDIKRMYRYLDKNVKKVSGVAEEDEDDDDDEF
jgi:DNA polymerase III delta prime subunit